MKTQPFKIKRAFGYPTIQARVYSVEDGAYLGYLTSTSDGWRASAGRGPVDGYGKSLAGCWRHRRDAAVALWNYCAENPA
jgi:hypothetical protein